MGATLQSTEPPSWGLFTFQDSSWLLSGDWIRGRVSRGGVGVTGHCVLPPTSGLCLGCVLCQESSAEPQAPRTPWHASAPLSCVEGLVNKFLPRACSYFFKTFSFFIFLERVEGREKERERNINVRLPLMWPSLGTWPATQACALTGNRTGDPFI